MNWLIDLIGGNPFLLLFLVLGIGFVLGDLKIGTVQAGSVAGVLFIGLLFGHFGFVADASLQTLGFVMFIFSVGYEAGPRFVQAVRKDGRRYLAIALIVAVSGFGIAYTFARALGFEPGVAAGLMAGALTSTPTLAAADAAIASPDFVAPEGFTVDAIRTNLTTAYAITYIFGLVGLILIIRLLPRILKIDLAAEARELERQEASATPPPAFAPQDVVTAALRLDSDEFTGRPLAELYTELQTQFTVHRVSRDGEIFEPTLETELQRGDIVAIVGVLTERTMERLRGQSALVEVYDRELLDVQNESAQVCVTRREVAGRTLGELEIPQRNASFVSRIKRLGVDLDVSPTTRIERGDVLLVTGPQTGLEALGARLGHLERDVEKTDLRALAFAIVIGIVIGSFAIEVAGISIGLGTSGGLLVAGLTLGYLRSLFPVFGRVPPATRWMFAELGLLVFMAGVGLRGGSGLVETLRQSGLSLILCGVVITTAPMAIAYFFGRKVLRMNPLMLLGSITGAMTSGGALSVVSDQARSSVASIGYTGAYAIANILLTIAGAVIVAL